MLLVLVVVEWITGRFIGFFFLCTIFNTAFPSDCAVSEDAGIVSRTVALQHWQSESTTLGEISSTATG
jgi:hypothetical protein